MIPKICKGKKLNKPFKTPNSRKKSAVCVKYKGKIHLVRFGDPDYTIKKNIPSRKKSYCSRSAGIKSSKPKILQPNHWSRLAWGC